MMKFAGLESAVKTAMSEKALELEGWKELLKNKTWELTKPNITIAKELIKPNLTALKSEIEGMFDPIDFVKGMKDAKPSVHDLKMVDDEGKMMKDLKTELNDMYGMKANLTKVEKLVKKEMLTSAEDKLDMLANITSGVKDEAEEKLEVLINATAAAKGEVLDKVIDLKNATIAKVDMFALEKEEIMGGAKNVTSKFMDKKAMLMDEAVNVTAKFTDKKALIVGKYAGAKKNVTNA